jgi:succinoglycan biosynthesis protein ExoA
VWLDPGLAVGYLPRGDLRALVRQFRGYGRGRARTARRHRGSLRARQLAAPVLVAGLVVGSVLAALTPLLDVGPWTVVPLAGLLSGYGAVLAAGARSAALGRSVGWREVALALAAMHLAWGVGFIGAVLRPGGPSVGNRS